MHRVPAGAAAVAGDPLDPVSYAAAVQPGHTVVHLVGTPHPSPAKAAEFARVDLPSICAAVMAAVEKHAAHLVYVSVAHPAPVTQAYIAIRSAPIYGLAGLVPFLRDGAERLGLGTIEQMVASLAAGVTHPPQAGSQRIVTVPAIRRASMAVPT